jgi:glycosyltransferase involved in cell wall biosynthesis
VGKILATVPFRRWRSLEVTGESLWGVLCGFAFARMFVERGIEHIHADWASGAATAAWTAHLLTGLPFSFTGRAADIFPPDGALVEKAQACSFIRTDVGRNVEYLMREGHIPREKIHLIYAAMTMKNVQTAPVSFQKPFKLLALGRFVEKKGFDVLIQACALLQQQGVDFELTLAGDGGLARSLKRLTAELGLAERVHFPGFLSHDQLMRTDVFVMPCKVSGTGDRDGIPNVIMEALSYRLPVVSTDVSGIGEVVIDNETGALVRQKDPAALAAGIKRLLDDRQLALRLAENGRKLVHERFDPQNVAKQLAEMFSKKKS